MIEQSTGLPAAPRPRQVKEPIGDRIFNLVNLVALGLFLVVLLYPLIYIVSASFSNSDAVTSGRVWLWPVQPTLDGYTAVFQQPLLLRSVFNTIFYTAAGTLISVALTVLAAFPLARRSLPGRRFISFLFFFTLLFSGGLIPSYLVVRDLGLLNTAWSMLLPGALGVFNIFLMRSYFEITLPRELQEAAEIDGASDFTILWRVVLPLSGPVIAVVILFNVVGQWNSYFGALIYLRDPNLWPLQLVLREVLVQNQVDPTMLSKIDPAKLEYMQHLRDTLKYALIVVATVPLMAVYPFVQRHFVKGIMLGAVKG